MKIQLITGRKDFESQNDIVISDMTQPKALDDFDVDVIDLSYSELWKYEKAAIGRLNHVNDLKSLARMVRGTQKAKIIYVFPQDGEYLYDKQQTSYRKQERIKDLIRNNLSVRDYEACFSNAEPFQYLIYEPTHTCIAEKEYNAAFHFSMKFQEILTKSSKSEKITTVKYIEKVYFTTLDICNSLDDLDDFIQYLFAEETNSDIPEWVADYTFGDDLMQKETIKTCNETIEELKNRIKDAQTKLEENNKYKSILYANGNKLVEVIFDILEKTLDCDLNEFVDMKKEDFLIEKDGTVFIGEIKGVTSNVKNEHISQLELHYQTYIDERLQNEQNEDNVHALLIINPFRTKPLSEREPICDKQISLAQRNKSLIIETGILLRLFETFQMGRISSDRIIEILKTKTGILTVDDWKTEQ